MALLIAVFAATSLLGAALPAGAVTLDRTWAERARREFTVEAEVFLLDDREADPILVPYGSAPVTHLKLRLGEDPAKMAPLRYGQADRIYAFCVVARSGSTHTASFVFLVPSLAHVSNRWVPAGALQHPDSEIFDRLPQNLLPVEPDTIPYFLKQQGSFYSQTDLNRFLKSGLASPFPVLMRAERGKAQAPCSIDAQSLVMHIDGEGCLKLAFEDPGLSEDGKHTAYRFRITRHGRCFIDGKRKARPHLDKQGIVIGIGDPLWRRPLWRNKAYRMELWVKKDIYGLKRPRKHVFTFRYRPTTRKTWRWRGERPAL